MRIFDFAWKSEVQSGKCSVRGKCNVKQGRAAKSMAIDNAESSRSGIVEWRNEWMKEMKNEGGRR